MKDKKYLLCLKIKKDGKNVYYELAEASLFALDKYTSFCIDDNELLWYMPNDEPVLAKDFLKKFFVGDYDASIEVRTSLSPRAKTIPMLYKGDVDVLVVNSSELKETIKKLISFSIDDYENGTLSSEKISLLKKLYDEFVTEDIKRQMNYNKRKRLDPDKNPNLRYEKILDMGYLALGLLPENIELLVKKAASDYWYKRRLALFIKEHQGRLMVPSIMVQDRLDYIKNGLELKKESNYYIRRQINGNVSTLKSSFKVVRKPSSRKPVKHATDYNDEYLKRFKNDETGELNKEYYDAKREIEIEEEIKRLSFELKAARKVKDDELTDKLILKISELRYELNSLQKGVLSYSDAGFIIDNSLDK